MDNAKKRKQKALSISTDTYNTVMERDGECIICKKEPVFNNFNVLECHHYISRGRLGMGIPENLVMICKIHHGKETKYRDDIEKYLKSHYENWNKERLVFRKYE